jgi:hypothetical protein
MIPGYKIHALVPRIAPRTAAMIVTPTKSLQFQFTDSLLSIGP